MNIFKKIGEWVVNSIRKIMGSKEIGFLEEIEKIATPIIESVTHMDFNGDGKIAGAKEVIEIAKIEGLMFGKELLELGEEEAIKLLSEKYLTSDLMKWISTARIIKTVAEKFGINTFIQKSRIVHFIIQKVLLQTLDKFELKFNK